MGIVIGLDIGGSTTKIIGINKHELLGTTLVRASDPVASAFGAFGKFTNEHAIDLKDIERVMVTGVGSSYLTGDLLHIKTIRTPEFQAIGLGGLYASGLDRAIVVSMGTGTAFISADESGVEHIIGSGVGGGTLLGLSNRMTNVRDFQMFTELAETGDLGHIDLTIGDISRKEIPGLSSDTTASNFGKVNDTATSSDIALGIVNLVFQSVGTAAVLSAKLKNISQIVFTGNLTLVSQGKRVLGAFSKLYGVDIIVPEHAEFATAIGAALCDPDDPSRGLEI
ncbi:MAG: type pantothenate kinase [Clostridiales bacterium]|jgi:type II pantothenate kinase|nr:type pantothenate kinase [Clostridiales bacterium]